MSDFFLADDLSGALDAAAGFHHAGQRVTIALTEPAWRRQGEGEVVGFTTESRNAAPDEAAGRVTRAIAHGRALGGRLVYKKIDSTLRGPVAAEVGALAAALPEVRILFAPANPRAGRTVRDGVLLVQGVPVAETEFGRDPISPVKESAIARVLGNAAPGRVVIPDIATERDLEVAVARMEAAGSRWVAVGSGALARPVAARRRAGNARAASLSGEALPPGPTLMICGSAHAKNREQAALLAGTQGVAVVEFDPRDARAAAGRAASAIRARGAVALLVEERRGDSTAVLRELARIATELIRTTGAQRIFITGGETAFAICAQLGVVALEFLGEIEPGLSLSRGAPEGGPALRFAIKPGGFGDTETWDRAWRALAVS